MSSSAPSVTLYIDRMSQPARAVVLFCLLNRIPFIEKSISIGKAEHRTKEFAAINPNRKVPYLTDGSFGISESHAILKYLHSKYNVSDDWFPSELQSRSKVEEYLHWHHTNLRYGGSRLLVFTVFGPQFGLQPEVIDFGKRDATNVLNQSLGYLNQILSKQPYIASTNHPTIADLSAAMEMTQMPFLSFEWKSKYPAVAVWLSGLEQLWTKNGEWNDVHGKLLAIVQKQAEKKQKEKAATTPRSAL